MPSPRSLALAFTAILVGCADSNAVHGTGSGGDTSSTSATTSSSGSGGSGGAGGSGGTGGATTSTSGTAGAGGSANPCAGKIGTFCGASLGLDTDKLYDCNNAEPVVDKTCPAGCVTHDNGGDACACQYGDGLYCGQVVGADATKLYNCAAGILTVTAQCIGTCDVMPPGTNDTCGTCPSGNGLYCGSGINMDPSTLYNCNNGVLTVAQMCPSPCHVNPPGTNDTCGTCPSGNGAYCGASLGAGFDPNTLYDCNNGNVTVTQQCPSTCHVAPPGQPDYCNGNGELLCSSLQWWNSAITYGPYTIQNGASWWDTDLAVGNNTAVELRHDSKLVQAPVEAWGWQPRFVDMVTGKTFQFLHLHPQSQYTTAVGTVYPAGTIVGLSGGGTSDTGYPTYSTGPHLCVETLDSWSSTFPQGTDPCH